MMVLQNLENTQLSNQALSIFFTQELSDTIYFPAELTHKSKGASWTSQVIYPGQELCLSRLLHWQYGAYIGPLNVFHVNLPRQMVVI